MGWFSWAAAGLEAVLILLILLLWLDNLRQRVGWTSRRALRHAAPYAVAVPLGFAAVLVSPVWLAIILLVVPILALLILSMAD